MASIFSRRAVPYLTGATAVGAGAAYYASRPRIQLDSAHNAPTKTLSMPTSMLFPKQITVANVEQVNHDTKKITFKLPGGEGEVSGVPAGGMRRMALHHKHVELTLSSRGPDIPLASRQMVPRLPALHTHLRR